MGKREIRKMAEEFADRFAAIVAGVNGDLDVAREAWIDVGGNNAGWKRRATTHAEPAKRTKRPGARAGR